MLAYFVYTSTATFVATLRKGDEVKPNCQVSRGRALLGVGAPDQVLRLPRGKVTKNCQVRSAVSCSDLPAPQLAPLEPT